jgi:hypothetical protein
MQPPFHPNEELHPESKPQAPGRKSADERVARRVRFSGRNSSAGAKGSVR